MRGGSGYKSQLTHLMTGKSGKGAGMGGDPPVLPDQGWVLRFNKALVPFLRGEVGATLPDPDIKPGLFFGESTYPAGVSAIHGEIVELMKTVVADSAGSSKAKESKAAKGSSSKESSKAAKGSSSKAEKGSSSDE